MNQVCALSGDGGGVRDEYVPVGNPAFHPYHPSVARPEYAQGSASMSFSG